MKKNQEVPGVSFRRHPTHHNIPTAKLDNLGGQDSREVTGEGRGGNPAARVEVWAGPVALSINEAGAIVGAVQLHPTDSRYPSEDCATCGHMPWVGGVPGCDCPCHGISGATRFRVTEAGRAALAHGPWVQGAPGYGPPVPCLCPACVLERQAAEFDARLDRPRAS